MGSQKKRQEARQSLDLLSKLQETLADPALWRREAEDAVRRRADRRKAREAELADWLEVLKSSGTCGEEQFAKICQQFEDTLSAQELRAKLAAAGIQVGTAAKQPKPPRARTEPVLAANVRRNLELLKLASLYEFLGREASSPAAALRARAEEIYKASQRLGRTDAEATARNDLAGLAKTIFQSEEDKKKYDTHRLLEAIEAIENQIQAAGADRVLTSQELDTLVRLASQRGATPGEARDVLEERAAKEGWRIVPSAKAPLPPPRDTPTHRGEAGAREKPGPAGSPAASRGRVSRAARGAAAGATLLLALSTAAMVWGPPPFDLLAGWLPPGPAPRQTHRTKRPAPPPPTRQPAGAQGLSSRPPTAATSPAPLAPPPASGTKPKAAEPTAASPQSPSPPSIPPIAAPAPAKRGTPKNAAGSNSGGSGSTPAVLASSAKLPPQRQIPQPPVLLPSSPEVAVVAVGDALLASPLEAELERAFRSEGLGIVSGSPSIDSLRQNRGGNPSISEILGSLRGDGVRAVVIAQVDRLGSRELSFYGRKDVSSTSRVHIQAYLVDGRRSISSWSEQIEYTAASAATEGETAAHRAAPSLASSVRSAWESLRAAP